jgi:folate-dependent phosphoribosylglycinamide formyltransferase PurN
MWVALFSQTGSEIYNISKRIKRRPDFIFSNNKDYNTWHPGLLDLDSSIVIGTHAELMATLKNLPETALVTLHGYLRILPAEIVERFEIINGHPGDIVKYPAELKGKDPQAKAIELGLPSTGVVLHKAVAEVDAGEILKYEERTIHAGTTTEQLILDLKAIQLDLWCELLRERL